MKKTPAYYLPIMGTWGQNQNWKNKDSTFAKFAASHNIVQYPRDPFVWSGDIDGIFKQTDWIAAGAALSYYLETIQLSHRNLIVHSHGLQVVAYAVGMFDANIKNVITIASPIRNDMDVYYERLGQRVDTWVNIYDSDLDVFMRFGKMFDGSLYLNNTYHLANNFSIKGIGHSGLLIDESKFPLWLEHNWFDVLR